MNYVYVCSLDIIITLITITVVMIVISMIRRKFLLFSVAAE